MNKKTLIFKLVIRLVLIVILVICFIFGCRYSRAECLVVGNSGSAMPWSSEHLSASTPMRRVVLNCDSDSVPPVTLQPWFDYTPIPDSTPMPTCTPEPSVSPYIEGTSDDNKDNGVRYLPHNTQLYVSNYSTSYNLDGDIVYCYYIDGNPLMYASQDSPPSILMDYSEDVKPVPYGFGEVPLDSACFNIDFLVYMRKNPISIPSTGEFIYSIDSNYQLVDILQLLEDGGQIPYKILPYYITLDIKYVGVLNGKSVYLYDTLFPISTNTNSFGLSSVSRDLVGVMDSLYSVTYKLKIYPDKNQLDIPLNSTISCNRIKFKFQDYSNLTQSFDDQMTNLFVPSGDEISNALGSYMDTYSNDAMAGTFSKVIGYLQEICSSQYESGSSELVFPPLSVKVNGTKYYYFKGGILRLKAGTWTNGGVVDPNDENISFPVTSTVIFGDPSGDKPITNQIFLYLRSFNTVLIAFGFCNLMVDMIFRYRNGSRFYLSDKEMHDLT